MQVPLEVKKYVGAQILQILFAVPSPNLQFGFTSESSKHTISPEFRVRK